MKLEICVNCYNYEKRLNWMLNSILQQHGDIPDILVNISYTKQDKEISTDKVCKFFLDQGLNIKETILDEKQILNRSLARNIQAEETNADWILFADCDMVYSPGFFSNVKSQLENAFKNEDKVIGADRVSLTIEHCMNYFEHADKRSYPCVIPAINEIVSKWPVYYIKGKRTAAGYFQLANVASLREKGGKYSGTHRDSPRRYRADRGFRCLMGGRVGMSLVEKQYHLNHTRDDPEKQR